MPKTGATPPTSTPRAPRKSHQAPLTRTEIEAVHLLASGKSYADTEAALDLPAGTVEKFLHRDCVQTYRAKYEDHFVQAMAEEEARRLVKRGVGREDVLTRLMELAYLSPDRTRGSIQGQVDSLREMAAILGMKMDEKKLAELFGGMTDEQLKTAPVASTRAQ